ncbi:MAG: hypothetical protein A2284_01350 [Deltaproteobacteria bacterium RIFOXYA12_FULL_61_11]|nr:MAG: hypothetical protein A2284_01350 [Deltaproteobacteria bacterium RIFOXYA12_FULL_61_11]
MAGMQHEGDAPISGINVTPLLDVVLVILIIFMVTASLTARQALQLDLPRAQTASEQPGELLGVSLTSDGRMFYNGRPGSLDDLPQIVSQARERAAGKPVSAFVAADRSVPYGLFAEVIDRLRLEGIEEIALDTQPVEASELER